MPIGQFDKLADRDQADYVRLLVRGAERLLSDQPKIAALVHNLFTIIPAGDKTSLGMTEFEINLARMRLVDAKHFAANPAAPRFEVEHAVIMTLKNNGIELPKTFLTVASSFKAKFPPREAK